MTQSLPILVAGGGIGGLAAALVLATDGHAVTVLEQSSAFGEIGAGIQLGPNIFRMFDHLGLTDAVSRVAFFPPGLGMNDVRTGEKVVRVPLGDVARAAYGFPYGVIYRADLHDVFLQACQALPNVTLRTSAKVESFSQNADEVHVQLVGGEMLTGAALIGFSGGLFSVGMLLTAMELPERELTGLVLGAWGAVQATAAGVSMAIGGVLRDLVGGLATGGWLGSALNSPVTGYSFVFHLEIYLLFVVLIALGPLVRRSTTTASRSAHPIGLAELPG